MKPQKSIVAIQCIEYVSTCGVATLCHTYIACLFCETILFTFQGFAIQNRQISIAGGYRKNENYKVEKNQCLHMVHILTLLCVYFVRIQRKLHFYEFQSFRENTPLNE